MNRPAETLTMPNVIECINPATGERLGEVPVDDVAAVRDKIARARAAQQVWAQTSFATRRAVLRDLLDHILDHADDICRDICADAGKTLENAMMGEIWPVAEKLRWTIRNGERYLRDERVSPGLFLHKKARIEYHPLGVIGVIAPWNYPFQNIMGPIIPALMAGNACVVKVSEAVAWSSERFGKLLRDTFAAHDLPEDLVIIVQGYAETGRAVITEGSDLIVFTGSMPNGRKIIEASAERLVPVILELGGKDPMIICDDADLDEAVHTAMSGVFIACGQNCLAAERILVMDGIYDAFVERVSEMARNLRQGPPLAGQTVDVGAIVSARQVEIIDELVQDAIARGARVLAGGQRPTDSAGQFYPPTVLADVTDEMRIMHEETFGPVMVIRRVADDEDAIRVANAIDYGLASSVFSRDLKRARRIARQIQAGATCINDFGFTYMAQELPFGGVKGSGFGRLNGREGLRAMTNRKAVLDDRIPLHQPVKLFPVSDQTYDEAHALIDLIYRRGLRAKVGALARMVRARFGGGS
ncbi:MAG: aldehyde dehydrogenase family protein [Candidatus Dadabacteria bacterium]|nr:MAG: aldehyde dehydrogenase family protein [Candidatus Dadabacteria bacterium]